MIVSASYRTDIPAYYGDWFRRRLRAGFALVRNPYSGQDYRVSLKAEDVTGFVFWTRNPTPFGAALEDAAALGRPILVQMTITGYPRTLEPGVLEADAAVAAFRGLAERLGPRAVVWRYDPVLLTDGTPPAWHRTNVRRLADALARSTDECVFSFAQIYRKSRRNLTGAAVEWSDPQDSDKAALLQELAAIVGEAGMTASLCAQPDLLSDGLAPARCIDARRLADIAGGPVQARTKGQRPGCLCAEARDIGRYDLCPQGCAYCYANASRAAARAGLARHDPHAERL